MRLHVRDWAVNGLLDLVTAHASLFGYRRSVDCDEAMYFARVAPSRCSPLSANRVRTGDDVWWGQILSRREIFVEPYEETQVRCSLVQDSLVRFGEEVEMGDNVQRAET